MLQDQVFGAWQSNPLVVDGVMYVTERPNDVMAVDAKTGRMYWLYRYTPSPEARVCCGANNRGVAILGDTLFMGTLDAHLIAIDAKNGKPLWNVAVADVKLAYSITLAPLVVKDKVIVGVGGGEYGIRGFIAAYDAKTGKEAWRFYTIPGPGEPGHDTLERRRLEVRRRRRSGSPAPYDPDSEPHLLGHRQSRSRLESRASVPATTSTPISVVALDADTGKLKWHFQFTPNDGYDYDSVQVPVLADINWKGTPTKVMMWANRNGYLLRAGSRHRQIPARQQRS